MGRVLLLVLGLATVVASWLVTCRLWDYREKAAGIAYLEDRAFETLTLITAGTGTAYENPRRLGPASAIGFGPRVIVVDAGRGVAEALRYAEIPVSQPEAVLLTSLLPENTLGLDDLLFTGWLAPREQPLRLVGPTGTRALAEALQRAHQSGAAAWRDGIGLPAAGGRIEVVEVADGWSETRDGLSVQAGDVGAEPLPQLAYRFEAGGRSIVVSGSGPDPDRLARFAEGAWVLAAEGFHSESVDLAIEAGAPDPDRLRREAALHRGLLEVGRIADRAGVLALVLTRLRPPPLADSQYTEPIEAIFEGRVVVADEADEFRP